MVAGDEIEVSANSATALDCVVSMLIECIKTIKNNKGLNQWVLNSYLVSEVMIMQNSIYAEVFMLGLTSQVETLY